MLFPYWTIAPNPTFSLTLATSLLSFLVLILLLSKLLSGYPLLNSCLNPSIFLASPGAYFDVGLNTTLHLFSVGKLGEFVVLFFEQFLPAQRLQIRVIFYQPVVLNLEGFLSAHSLKNQPSLASLLSYFLNDFYLLLTLKS